MDYFRILKILHVFTCRIQSESRSRERTNADQQKRSLSYGDKLNGGNNNRRQLPTAPSYTASNNTNKGVKHVDQRSSVEKDSDLKIREPTPDYDTQSMASIIPPDVHSRSETAMKHEGRRNSADSTGGSNGNGKRRFDGNRSLSSNGSTKEASNSLNQKQNNNEGNNKINGKVDHDEKGKPFPTILQYVDIKTCKMIDF